MAAYFQTTLRPDYEKAISASYEAQAQLARESVLAARSARQQGATTFGWAAQDRATEQAMRQQMQAGGRGLSAMLQSMGRSAVEKVGAGWDQLASGLRSQQGFSAADILRAGAGQASNFLMGAAGRGMGGTTSARLTAAGMGTEAQREAARSTAEYEERIGKAAVGKGEAEAAAQTQYAQMLAQAGIASPEVLAGIGGGATPISPDATEVILPDGRKMKKVTKDGKASWEYA